MTEALNGLLQLALSNVVLAAGLAIVALVVSRVWRNRHVAHLLWLLVLAKFWRLP